MRLGREEVIAGYTEELERFEELVRGLDEKAWQTPTRCEGWTPADIAAHVTGTLTEIANGRFDGIGSPEGIARVVAERKGRSPAELGDELQQARKSGNDILGSFDDESWAGPGPNDVSPSVGEGVEALWYDAYIHNQDIRAATGQPSERGPGLRVAVAHLADLLEHDGYGPTTLALDGMEEFRVSGGGERITGDPLQFVLVATGREDPSTMGLRPEINVYRNT